MIYQCFLLRLDFPGPFHKIMTVSNEKIDYILKQRVWQHSFTTAVTSQNNLIRRIFAIDTAVFELIMGASLPLTFVRKQEFKNLVNTLQPGKTVMSYKSVRKDMQRSFAEMKDNMRKQFSTIDYICTTQDLWTEARRSWLGMSAHWLDEDLNRVSCVLACYKMKESSTFDVLAQSIHDIYKDGVKDVALFLFELFSEGCTLVCMATKSVERVDQLKGFINCQLWLALTFPGVLTLCSDSSYQICTVHIVGSSK